VSAPAEKQTITSVSLGGCFGLKESIPAKPVKPSILRASRFASMLAIVLETFQPLVLFCFSLQHRPV
jgi:hypothetical protein